MNNRFIQTHCQFILFNFVAIHRKCPTLLANDRLVWYIVAVWMCGLLYFETISLYRDIAACTGSGAKWRDPSKKEASKPSDITRVVVISDPRLITGPLEKEHQAPSLRQQVKAWINDLWMKKFYQVIQSVARPELVVFAGKVGDVPYLSAPLLQYAWTSGELCEVD